MAKFFLRYFLCCLFIAAVTTTANGQTCSCAGAPLIGSQTIGSTGGGNMVLGLTFEHNEISSLYNESEKLANETVRRNTKTLLFEANYGLTDRLSLNGTFTYIQKFRKAGLHNPSFTEELTISGVGDGMFMLKYALHRQTIWEPYEIAVGGGAKIPFGTTFLEE